MAKKNFWEYTSEELENKLRELKAEIRKARFDIKAGRERNVKKIKNLKKDVARILTVLNFRKKFGKERP
jgi:large subunit ribosomal protein L29